MTDQFLGEIRIFGTNFAPIGWAQCNGQLLSIAQNTALFSILGTTYGGDGRSTFALPNLQGNVPVGMGQLAGGQLYDLGETGGVQSVTVLSTTMPAHGHTLQAHTGRGLAPQAAPVTGSAFTTSEGGDAYGSGFPNTPLNATALGSAGASQPHNNVMPSLPLNFCVAMQGVFPPRG
ncbi:MAG: phage tail protein [Solirubrobacteraceae bacterium]